MQNVIINRNKNILPPADFRSDLVKAIVDLVMTGNVFPVEHFDMAHREDLETFICTMKPSEVYPDVKEGIVEGDRVVKFVLHKTNETDDSTEYELLNIPAIMVDKKLCFMGVEAMIPGEGKAGDIRLYELAGDKAKVICSVKNQK